MKTKTTTQDIYFSAAMLSLGAKLDDTDKTDVRHMKFTLSFPGTIPYVFHSENIPNSTVVNTNSVAIDFEYYENQWANATLMVNATKFKDALQRMKSVVHSS